MGNDESQRNEVTKLEGVPQKARGPLTWISRVPTSGVQERAYSAVIRRANGTEVFRLDDVQAPETWGDMALDIAAQKYFIRRGAKTADGKERSVFAMVGGVARAIGTAGDGQGYFRGDGSLANFEHDLYHLLLTQAGAFNSPVWFNVRHSYVHGIQGSGGNWAWSSLGAFQVEDGYRHPQCSACFITSVDDSLVGPQGIAEGVMTEMRIFKRGSGVGSNFSRIREKDAPLSGGGGSSGLLSFLEVFDKGAGSTKSGGTTRRAAKMVILDVDHPEIEAFIQWKVREEKKAQDLIAAGWSAGMEGDAYTTVSGQNANNSVRVTDEFMNAVNFNRNWGLKSRLGGHIVKTVSARALWRQIAEASWACADPGVQFDTTINKWHTTPSAGRISASNPCSEYMHLDDSACNLASIRLTKFYKNGVFDIEAFKHACHTFIVAQDILVDHSSYPTARIAENAHRYRQLGLGYADLGALLMLMGVPYDSVEGRELAAHLTSLMTAQAYLTSTVLAEHLGPFEGYEADRADMLKVLRMHEAAATTVTTSSSNLVLRLRVDACTVWRSVALRAEKYGVRNSQVTVLAPTGTIGFLMGCTTTGIEPLLAHRQYKTLAGGGSLVIVNDIVPEALKQMGYTPEVVQSITDYVKEHGYFTGSALAKRDIPVFDTAFPAHGDPSQRSLSPESHVRMVAAVQPFLSGAVSKTVNLPNSATVEDFEAMHMLAWELGLKAVALYRDGSKGAQPVKTKADDTEKSVVIQTKRTVGKSTALYDNANHASVDKSTLQPTPYTNDVSKLLAEPPAPQRLSSQRKLPKQRHGITWALKLDEHKIYIRSGEYEDGTLGEIFVDLAKEGSTLGGLVGMWAKAVSLAIQHGAPLEQLVETYIFTRFEPLGRVLHHPSIRSAMSIVDLVMRVVAVHYLKRTDLQHVQPEVLEDTTVLPPPGFSPTSGDGPPCPECGAITKRNGTCHRCPNCGLSLGCS